jgi:hypothetical protein
MDIIRETVFQNKTMHAREPRITATHGYKGIQLGVLSWNRTYKKTKEIM